MPVLFSGETTLQIGRKVLDFIRYLLMEQKTRRKEKEGKKWVDFWRHTASNLECSVKLRAFGKVLKNDVAHQSFHTSNLFVTAVALADILRASKFAVTTVTPKQWNMNGSEIMSIVQIRASIVRLFVYLATYQSRTFWVPRSRFVSFFFRFALHFHLLFVMCSPLFVC